MSLRRLRRAQFLALLAAAEYAVVQTAPSKAQSTVIRVGTTPNDSYTEPFYAQDEAFTHAPGSMSRWTPLLAEPALR